MTNPFRTRIGTKVSKAVQFTVIVPVRLASTRLPDKPLAEIGGKPILLHVLQRAREADAERIVVATDAPQLVKLATEAGFEAVLTGPCANGTERAAQAAAKLEIKGIIVNLQGDEPAIDPAVIRAVAQRSCDGHCDCATAAAPISRAQAASPDNVKVVLRGDGTAACFSRAPIPFFRVEQSTETHLGHIGLYAFAPGKLAQSQQLPPCEWEQTELLEQLRWLWHGWSIATIVTPKYCHGIDTPDDLQAARENFNNA